VKRLAAALFLLLLILMLASVSLAARGDPQKKITPADQARAKAMLLRKSDFGPAFTERQASSSQEDFYCAAIDLSDVTLTGQAKMRTFTEVLVSVSSSAAVYESVDDANAAWRRETSAAGTKCVQGVLRREFARGGLRLLSFRKAPFPRLAERSIAYRIAFSGQVQGVATPVYIDIVALQQSRGQAGLFFAAPVRPVELSERRRLAGIVAGRMVNAMRR